MTRKKLTLMAAMTAAALGASPMVMANPTVPATDMQAAKAIQRTDVSIQSAITKAEKVVDGTAIGARFAENAAQLAYMVDVVNNKGDVMVVKVTGDNGKVTGVWPKSEYAANAETYREPN